MGCMVGRIKLALNSQDCCVADASGAIKSVDFQAFGRLCCHSVAVDIVTKVEHTRSTLSKVGDFCRPNVQRPLVLYTLVRKSKRHDRPCRISHCHQCVLALTPYTTDANYTPSLDWQFSLVVT